MLIARLIMAAALFGVGLWSGAPAWVVVLCFALYAFFNALSGNLTAVYPPSCSPPRSGQRRRARFGGEPGRRRGRYLVAADRG